MGFGTSRTTPSRQCFPDGHVCVGQPQKNPTRPKAPTEKTPIVIVMDGFVVNKDTRPGCLGYRSKLWIPTQESSNVDRMGKKTKQRVSDSLLAAVGYKDLVGGALDGEMSANVLV